MTSDRSADAAGVPGDAQEAADARQAAHEAARTRPVRRSRLRRRLSSAARLVAALAIVGGLYTAFAPGSHAEDTPAQLSIDAQRGKELYDASCITCHGRNGQGVTGRGPSLIGVGSAAVEFQVTTGRMPAARQEAQIERKAPQFTDEQAKDLAQYIQ